MKKRLFFSAWVVMVWFFLSNPFFCPLRLLAFARPGPS